MRFSRAISIGMLLLLALSAYAQEPGKDIQVNKQQFIDLQRFITDLREKKHIDLETPFVVAATATLDRNGKIDPLTFKYVRTESSSPEMLTIVKQGIAAFDESGIFQYVSDFGVKDIRIQTNQDGQKFNLTLESGFPNEMRAKSIDSVFKLVLEMKKQQVERKENISTDQDELFFLQNATSETRGKLWKFIFSVPKAEFWKMLDRKFTEQQTMQRNNVEPVIINKKPLPDNK